MSKDDKSSEDRSPGQEERLSFKDILNAVKNSDDQQEHRAKKRMEKEESSEEKPKKGDEAPSFKKERRRERSYDNDDRKDRREEREENRFRSRDKDGDRKGERRFKSDDRSDRRWEGSRQRSGGRFGNDDVRPDRRRDRGEDRGRGKGRFGRDDRQERGDRRQERGDRRSRRFGKGDDRKPFEQKGRRRRPDKESRERDERWSDRKRESLDRDQTLGFKPRITASKTEQFKSFAEFYFGEENEKQHQDHIKSKSPTTPEVENQTSEEPQEKKKKRPRVNEIFHNQDQIMRLNKYIAKSGICSRRKAAELVKEGLVTVNGKVETHPAYEIQEGDVIEYDGRVIEIQDELVYLLLNKPKGYITTMDDEKDRKTVMDLVADRVDVRIYPVGRLDRNTTGLLLFTNDGALAANLSHPSFLVQKFYQVTLDRPVEADHLTQIRNGIELEDGPVEVDAVDYVEGASQHEVGIEIHIGRNRIVRRIFEHFGYRVEKLDRTYYAGLTKKDLPRGWSRPLTNREIVMLKHFTGKK